MNIFKHTKTVNELYNENHLDSTINNLLDFIMYLSIYPPCLRIL